MKNQEERIECFIRSILFRLLYGKEDIINNVIITDLNSKDGTEEILSTLARDYETIEMLSWNDCKEIINNIEKS